MGFGILGALVSKVFFPQETNRSGEVIAGYCKKLNISREEVNKAASEFRLPHVSALNVVLLKHIYSIHLAVQMKNSARKLFERGEDGDERRKIFELVFISRFIEIAMNNFNVKTSAEEFYNSFSPYMNEMDGEMLAYEKHHLGPFFGAAKRYIKIVTGDEVHDELMFEAASDIAFRTTQLSKHFETLYDGGDRF